jgi:hypothetical protein
MDLAESSLELPEAPGQTNPVGARTHLRGRRNIVMTEWGPYDWTHPLLMLRESGPARHVYEVLGPEALADASLAAPGPVTLTRDGSRLIVETDASGLVLPYTLTASTEASVLSVPGTLMPTAWRVIVFASEADPREDAEAWRAAGEKNGVECELPALDLIYGRGGPSDLGLSDQIGRAGLPADNFGTIASTTIELPAGSWRVTTSSDDGIRVWLDEALVIDDWKWHPPKAHTYELELAEPKSVAIRVEHFELDGHAELLLDIEPVD